MEQKVEPLYGEDAQRVESQRSWVRDHFEPDARDQYETVEGKLRLIQTILDAGWIEPNETWKLQSLGIAFGDILVQELGLNWVTVEDDYGRDPALQMQNSTIIVFPLTAISKRIERGEIVDVRDLVKGFRETIEQKKGEGF